MDGAIRIAIKKAIARDPKLAIRNIPQQIMADMNNIDGDVAIPLYFTIHCYLKQNGYVMTKLIKAPMVSEKNRAQ